jgi:DNA polymerase-3 subunit beta
MKLIFDIDEFNYIMSRVFKATPRKSTLPVLEYAEFIIEGSNAHIRATDQDVLVKATIAVEAEHDCSFLMHREVMGLINTIKTDDLTIDFDEDNSRITIKTATGGHKFATIDAGEYLAEREVNGDPVGPFVITEQQKKNLTEILTIACSTDEYRPAMTGVFVEFTNDKLKMTSTDSFRMVHFEDDAEFEHQSAFILPVATVDLLKMFDGDVQVIAYKTDGKIKEVMFFDNNISMLSRVIDEQFPAYNSVIPDDQRFATMDPKDLHDVLSRMKYSIDVSNQVVLQVDAEEQKCMISAANIEAGKEGNEVIDLSNATDDTRIGFNHAFLSQFVARWQHSGKVVMKFSEPSRPIVFYPETAEGEYRLYLLMPVKV